MAITLALIAASGSILSAYVAAKVRTIAVQTNGRILHLENEIKLTRALLQEEVLRKMHTT